MTEQEIFSKAYLGLKAQGFVASIYGGQARYRGLDGLRCAFGHVMSDEEYDPKMEGRAAYIIQSTFGVFPGISIEFLRDLERCHNLAQNEKDMEFRLREFAQFYSLEVPE